MTSKHLKNSPFLFYNNHWWLLLDITWWLILNYICYIWTKYFFFPGTVPLMEKWCFWGLSIFLIQNRWTIFGFVPLCRQLILYRFLGFLGVHYHQFECRQKQMECISLHYFTGQMKKVIYVFHGNVNSFNMIFIAIT